MYLKKTVQDDKIFLELRSVLRDKWKGYLIMSIFLVPMITIFLLSSVVSGSVVAYIFTFAFLVVYVLLIGFHYWYSRHVLCIVDPSSQRVTIKRFLSGSMIPFDDCKHVVLRRKYHLWYQFGDVSLTTVNPEEELRKEYGHLYDIKLEWAPPPWMWRRGRNKNRNIVQVSTQVNLKEGTVDVFASRWLDVTNKPEIIEKYRYSSRTRIGPYDSAMTSVMVTDEARFLEVFVGIQTHSGGTSQPMEVLELRMDETTAMRQLAEELAEALGVPLLDESGMQPKVREPGHADAFMGEIIKEQLDGELKLNEMSRKSKNIRVDVNNDRVTRLTADLNELQGTGITTLKWLGFTGLILFCAILLSLMLQEYWNILSATDFSSFNESPVSFVLNLIFRIIFVTLVFFLSAVGLRFGVLRLNNVKRIVNIDINEDGQSVKQKGMFFSVLKGVLPLWKIEDVIVLQRWEWPRIEIVSDSKRIKLDGYYSFSTANQVKDILGLALATWA